MHLPRDVCTRCGTGIPCHQKLSTVAKFAGSLIWEHEAWPVTQVAERLIRWDEIKSCTSARVIDWRFPRFVLPV